MTGSLRTVALRPAEVELDEFVEFWSGLYRYPNDRLYTDHINHPIDDRSLDALFTWKNGGPLSEKKKQSLARHYYGKQNLLDSFSSETSPSEILQSIGGGAVWGVFFLHCLDSDRFPIFDQHVHRATRHLLGEATELITLSKRSKLREYEDRYLPLWFALEPARFGRNLDKALWAFGKALKQPSKSDLAWNSVLDV